MKNTSQNSVALYLEAHNALTALINIEEIEFAIQIISDKYQSGKKIITCGNGGSASTASHYITDWNKMVNIATGNQFRGISLCDNIGLITAFGNDLAYDDIFVGQLKSVADEGDLLIAISGSGNSPNILKAVQYANDNGMETLGVSGYDGGKLRGIANHSVWIPSFDMQLCEDFHLMFGHMVMKRLCGSRIK